MVEQNWYAVLGITSSATESEIKRAFRKLAHIYHPDKNSNPIFFEQFKQIKKAYEILGNNESKRLYDKSIQLEGKSAYTKPSIQHIQDLIRYFHLFEREMQQSDFRFINYDRIKWKLNYPLFLPLISEMIQMGSEQEQEKLLKQLLYVLSFLPYNELKAYQQKFEYCFSKSQYIYAINQLLIEKKLEAKWNQIKIPLVAFLSALLCLGIYILSK
jgi:curved DNA-binding protein CbpA